VPPGKEDIHVELKSDWAELCKAVERMKDAADSRNAHELATATSKHNDALTRLKTFGARYLMSELGN